MIRFESIVRPRWVLMEDGCWCLVVQRRFVRFGRQTKFTLPILASFGFLTIVCLLYWRNKGGSEEGLTAFAYVPYLMYVFAGTAQEALYSARTTSPSAQEHALAPLPADGVRGRDVGVRARVAFRERRLAPIGSGKTNSSSFCDQCVGLCEMVACGALILHCCTCCLVCVL